MSDKNAMLYNKRQSGATPWFDNKVRGEIPFGVRPDGANGNAGGYVRPEELRSNLSKSALPNK
jgi:hypothetical protein